MGQSDKQSDPSTQHSDQTYRSSPIRSRRAFLAATGATGTAVLAGCATGGDGDGGGDSGDGGTSTGTTTGSPGQESVELVWWHQENVPARIDRFKQLNRAFEQEYPNITVRQEPQTWGGIYAKLQSALSAGNEPDFWFNTPILAQEFHARGHLADVSGLQDDLSSEYTYYDRFVDQNTYDGGQWAIPNWNKGFQYFWKEDAFSGASTWPPQNWEQWLSGLKQATSDESYGFVLAASNTHFCYKQMVNTLAMKDTGVFGPDGKIMFNTDATVQALDFYKQQWNQTVPSSAVNWSWAQWSRALRNGTSFSTSCYSAPIVAMDDPQAWATMEGANPAPASGGPWGGGTNNRFQSTDSVSVFNEDKMDAIGKFMTYIHRPDVYGKWMRELNPTLFIPVHEEGWNADSFWQGAHSNQPMKKMCEVQNNLDNVSYPGFRDVHLENDTYVGQGIGAIEGNFPLGDVANQLIVQDKSPEAAAEWGQSHLESATGIGASDQL